MPLGPSKSLGDRLTGVLALAVKIPLMGLAAVTAVAAAVVGTKAVWRAAEWLWVNYLSRPWDR